MDPLELGTIAAILVVFFLWGPQKIPELARVIGQARKEFENATKEVQNIATSIQDETNPLFAASKPTARAGSALSQLTRQGARPVLPSQSAAGPSSVKTGDQLLIEAARKLGISTQGKTREQVQLDIIAMAQHSSPTPTPTTTNSASPTTTTTTEVSPQPPTKDDPPA